MLVPAGMEERKICHRPIGHTHLVQIYFYNYRLPSHKCRRSMITMVMMMVVMVQ